MTKEEIAVREKAIRELIETYSSKYLNEEIHEFCIKLVKKLGRKRDILFVSGKLVPTRRDGQSQLFILLLQ
jgi:hypothetical protein